MIDEKKIQEAAAGMFNAGSLMNAAEQIAFERGVYWFKKSLWHTEDEIPEADRLIITKGRNYKDEYMMFDTTEELCLADFDRKIQWKSFCELADLDFTWCYIKDLLPNK